MFTLMQSFINRVAVPAEPFFLQKAGAFPMTQNRALQLLYDLRYLNIILTARSEEAKASRSKHDSRCSTILGFRY